MMQLEHHPEYLRAVALIDRIAAWWSLHDQNPMPGFQARAPDVDEPQIEVNFRLQEGERKFHLCIWVCSSPDEEGWCIAATDSEGKITLLDDELSYGGLDTLEQGLAHLQHEINRPNIGWPFS